MWSARVFCFLYTSIVYMFMHLTSVHFNACPKMFVHWGLVMHWGSQYNMHIATAWIQMKSKSWQSYFALVGCALRLWVYFRGSIKVVWVLGQQYSVSHLSCFQKSENDSDDEEKKHSSCHAKYWVGHHYPWTFCHWHSHWKFTKDGSAISSVVFIGCFMLCWFQSFLLELSINLCKSLAYEACILTFST